MNVAAIKTAMAFLTLMSFTYRTHCLKLQSMYFNYVLLIVVHVASRD